MTGTSSEFALVCACAAWPPSPTRTARIHEVHAAGIDDEILVRVAVRHGAAALVAEGLRGAGVAPPLRLARAARRLGVAALRQAGEALRLQDELERAGIPALFLKGCSLACRAYGEIGIRDAFDIDLVVARSDVEAAWEVMADAGYDAVIPRRPLAGGALRVFQWAAKDSCLRHGEQGFVAELHWRLSDDLRDPSLPPQNRWERIEVAPGRRLASLRDEDNFVYLSVHGAAHLWARLKWIADIAALIAASNDGGARYWHAARLAGAERAAASGLLLAHRLLGTALPPGFEAPRSLRLAWLNRLALAAMTAGGGARDHATTPYRGWGELTAKLLIASRLRGALAVMRRVLVSPEDVGTLALPAPLSFLYPVLRIPLLIARRRKRAARADMGVA